MKKYLFLIVALISLVSYSQTPFPSGIRLVDADSITTSDTLALINKQKVLNKWVRGRNLPVKDVTINNYSHNGTLSSYLQGIDLALGAIQETTAGVLTRIYFTGDETTITSGTYYLSNVTGKGTASDVIQTVSNGDNTKTFFTQDIISPASLLTSTAKKGSYTSNLSVSTEGAGTGNDYSQRFTIEIYLTDNDGVPINSGVTGAPTGDLGVTVLTILDSGVLNMPYDAITNITLTGNLNEDVTLLAGNRIRYHVSAEKIGTKGGAVNQTLYLGSDHNSYYDVPTPILWGDIEGVLSNQVDLQNALDGKANVGDAYTKTESESRYVNVTGDTMTGDLTAPNFIGNGSHLTDVDAISLGGQPASYYNFRNYGLGTTPVAISDFDAVTQTGFYYNPLSGANGAPINFALLNLIHINIDSNSATQIVNRVGANQQWYRRKLGGVWQPWVEIYHTGNFTPSDYLLTTAKAADSNLLDGQDGTYYLDYNNFTNTPTLTNYLDKTTGGTITGTTLYDKTIAEQESASVKTVVNREFVEDYVANNAPTPDLSNYVDRTTDQTVGGSKDFTSNFNRFNRLNLKPNSVGSISTPYSGILENIDGKLLFYTKNTDTTNFVLDNSNLTTKREYDLPDKSGTLATLSDITNQIVTTTYASLPVSATTGQLAVITDANTVTYRGATSGGGSNVALVMYDGTNWIYH